MKKLFAALMVLVMMLALGATAFAETRAYMEWDEDEQMYGIGVYEVDDGPSQNKTSPYEDYEQLNVPASAFQNMIDWRDY